MLQPTSSDRSQPRELDARRETGNLRQMSEDGGNAQTRGEEGLIPEQQHRGADFLQAVQPAGWILEDEAVLPDGRHLSGSKARVYHLLRLAAAHEHRFPIGRHLAPAGWVPTWVLREPWAGGSAGDRRVRDLRALGLAVTGEPFSPPDGGSSSWVWRLGVATPACAARLNPGMPPLVNPATVSTHSPAAPPELSFAVASSAELLPANVVVVDLRQPAEPLAPLDMDPEAYRQRLLFLWRSGSLKAILSGLREVFFLFPPGKEACADVLAKGLLRIGAVRRGSE